MNTLSAITFLNKNPGKCHAREDSQVVDASGNTVADPCRESSQSAGLPQGSLGGSLRALEGFLGLLFRIKDFWAYGSGMVLHGLGY